MTTLRYRLIDMLDWFAYRNIPLALPATVLIIGVLALWGAVGRYTSAPTVDAAPTLAPIVIVATPQPSAAAQVASIAPNVLSKAIVVYDAPGGNLLGAVEPGRHYGYLARSGADWLQLHVDGSGAVWVRAADLTGIPALADLALTPAPEVVYVRQPAAATGDDESDTPTPNWYTDIATPAPAFVQALIGSDPNAPACRGSPWCGGITNAEAATAIAARH